MKAKTVIFSILVLSILGFTVAGHAQTATITYTYDDLNRLTNVSYQGGITQTFTPNDAGNLTASTVTTASVDSKGVNATTWAFFGNTSSCNCGIPDAWAYSYGLNYYDTNLAMEDPDSDGDTNLADYQAGDPPSGPPDPPPSASGPALSTFSAIFLTAAALGVILGVRREANA